MLRATLRLFERAVAAAGSGIIIVDIQAADQPIVYVNPAFEQITGYAAAEALGRNYRFLQAGDRDQPAQAAVRAAIAERRAVTVLLRNYRKDGTLFWNELSLAPVHDGGQISHVVGILTDITSRRQAETRLHRLVEAGALLSRQEDETAALAELAHRLVPDAADWCVIDVETEDQGRRRVAAIHRDPTLSPLLHHLTLEPLTGDEPILYEHAEAELWRWPDPRDQRAVSKVGLAAGLGVPLRVADRTLGTLVLATAAPRRLSYDDLAFAGELAARGALMLENRRLRVAAAETIRRRDQCLSAIAHDLKTPIAGIKGIAQVLHRRVTQGHTIEPERLLRSLNAIDNAASRLTEAVGRLKEADRSLSLEREPTDLIPLLRGLVERHQATTQHHRLIFTTLLAELVGRYDPARLDQAIGNLLTNAMLFSPTGGEIHVTLAQEESAGQPWAVLTVRDHGIGIPPADLPRIFERFHRAGNVMPDTPGSGLGLTSVRQIAESHGGAVAVESELGQGATFRLRLPLPARSPAPGPTV